jgi:hypothetical protein
MMIVVTDGETFCEEVHDVRGGKDDRHLQVLTDDGEWRDVPKTGVRTVPEGADPMRGGTAWKEAGHEG